MRETGHAVAVRRESSPAAGPVGWFRHNAVVPIAFLLAAGLVTAVMAYLGFAPFGDLAPFKWDSYLQHKDYYGYLWDVLHGEASIEYSTGKSLGGRIDWIDLPDRGIFGNTHLLMMDRNSAEVAGVVRDWMAENGLLL